MGYRKVGWFEQLLYIIEQRNRRFWRWVFGEERKDME